MSARTEFDALKDGLNGLASAGHIPQGRANVDMDDFEEFVPPEKIPFSTLAPTDRVYRNDVGNNDYEEEVPSFQSSPNQGHYTEPEYPTISDNDEALWPGGPLLSELESWKKQFTDIYMADDIDPNTIFIYRTINRYEYKAIIAAPNTDPLMREEMICEQCVLFPYEYSYGLMSNGNAGNVTTLAEHILTSSGFTKASIPRRL